MRSAKIQLNYYIRPLRKSEPLHQKLIVDRLSYFSCVIKCHPRRSSTEGLMENRGTSTEEADMMMNMDASELEEQLFADIPETVNTEVADLLSRVKNMEPDAIEELLYTDIEVC
jgi:hypothetical protein